MVLDIHFIQNIYFIVDISLFSRGRRGSDRRVVRFTTTYVISAYHH